MATVLLYAAGRQPPAAQDLSPRSRPAAIGRPSRPRGNRHRHVHRCGAQFQRFIVIDIHDHDTSENWIVDAEKPGEAPRLVSSRVRGVEYEIEHWNDQFIIKTNLGDAGRLQDRRRAGGDPSPVNWRNYSAPPGCFIAGFSCSRTGSSPRARERPAGIVVRNMTTGDEHSSTRRGSLLARLRRHARIRHGHFALHLLLDDDPTRFSTTTCATAAACCARPGSASGHDAADYVTRAPCQGP